MKDKIIDFSNGIFTYEQASLRIEPEMLKLEIQDGRGVEGSFLIVSCDERRVKGIVISEIPGFHLKKTSFFGRAARLEYEYQPQWIREGETREEKLFVESDAGEYEIPVVITAAVKEIQQQEEEPLPEERASAEVKQELKKGPGRSEDWKRRRSRQKIMAAFLMELERERRGDSSVKKALQRYRTLVDQLRKENPEDPVGPLMDAWVMFREGRKEEAGWILRKYEKTRLYQQKQVTVRAVFFYVNSYVGGNCLPQLQKLYQKQPENWILVLMLLEKDPKLQQDSRMAYKLLERQFRGGVRNRLLYQCAWELLKKDMALFTGLDAFALQTFAWASAHGFLTSETAMAAASQAAGVKHWSFLTARLLKACYQTVPCRETVGAVCAIYIRGHRTDEDAFVWYYKGVELDAKITNLYEYFMYALPDSYAELLPRQIILYFDYHNTLSGKQKTAFYTNLLRHGGMEGADMEHHRWKLQEFLLAQLKERRLNEQLAWLYEKCLAVETLEGEQLDALTDLLFLRKLTCKDRRIRQVEVRYEQLEQVFTVPLSGGSACIPIYTPGAEITLLDEQGRRYRKTVPYDLKRLLISPAFLQVCIQQRKEHPGLNLYLLEGKGDHRLHSETVETARQLLKSGKLTRDYERKLKLELLQYERKHRRLEKIEEKLLIPDGEYLNREEQGTYLEILILLERDEEAWKLLQKTGCRTADPAILLRLLLRLLEQKKISHDDLRPWAWEVFRKGKYTDRILALLAEQGLADTRSLLELWRACRKFDLYFQELEEQLTAQALYTERHVQEVFPVLQDMDERGTDPVMVSAWLNYLSWLDFVKEEPVPEGLFESLEQHMIWDDPLARVATLSYLRQLSVLLLLTDTQKRLAGRLLSQQWLERRRFAFLAKLLPYAEHMDGMNDCMTVEYRCHPEHRVILHYVLEYHGKKSFDYVTEQLYPVCGGVFTRTFTLFYGERLTWFFTEECLDGTEKSTVCKTYENREEHLTGDGRYERLCRMQKACDYRQERPLQRMMREYEALSAIAQEQFQRR